MKTAAHRRYDRFLFSMCGLSGLMYGIDVGLIAAALPYIRATCDFSTTQLASVVSAVLLGSIFGKMIAAQVCERFGRLQALRLTAVVFCVAVPVICFSGGAFALMFGGRLLQGVGCGMMGLATPIYMAECSPAESRGRNAGIIQLILCIGLVVAAVVGLVVTATFGAADADSVPVAQKVHAWQTIFWISIAPCFAMLVCSLRLRESPRWLFSRGREEEARRSLLANNPPEDAEATLAEMRTNLAAAQAVPTTGGETRRESVFQRKYVWPFLLAVTIATLTQVTGVNTILNYSVVLMHKAGLTDTGANWSDTAIKTVNVIMTLVAVSLVDRAGRKVLLSIGACGMAVGLLSVGCVFWSIERGWLAASPLAGWLATGGFIVFIAAFATGPGVCAWLTEGELMSTRIRANGMMLDGFVQMTFSWLLAQLFLPWSAEFGESSVFFTLTGFAVAFCCVAAFLLPETKGRSLEEIERYFARGGQRDGRNG